MLVDRYQRPIFNLMLRSVDTDDEAADLTQEAFVRAYDRLAQFKGEKRFFPWLYSLALNLARDWQRKKRTRKSKHHLVEQEFQGYEEDANQNIDKDDREDLRMLERAMLRLPNQTREILISRFRHGCSVKEVARAFDISESAAKMRLKRGVELLRDMLVQGDTSESQKN